MNAAVAEKVGWFRLWFGLADPVGRRAYVATGFSLMALKYAMDCGVIYLGSNGALSPSEFLSPFLITRLEAVRGLPATAAIAMALWTLPFLWIGVSMTVRRAADAGASPWLGILFLIPLLNYVLMLFLCFAPSKTRAVWYAETPTPVAVAAVQSALLGVAVGVVIALLMVGVSVLLLGQYGAFLFFSTPFLMGAASAFFFNRGHARTVRATLGLGVISMLIAGAALLFFALEGAMCIAMAMPLASVAGLCGAAVGRAIALRHPAPAAHLWVLVLLFPLFTGAEVGSGSTSPLIEVRSRIEIDRPPEAVWPNVVGFSDLKAPPAWFFRLGIAYPQRARIDGRGVGALRHCEFSTGAFVEPITEWAEPRRLAFDVTRSPPPMQEWSPYSRVFAPHLEGNMTSRRGRFDLLPLPGGRTELIGTTWYQLDLHPRIYWTLWSDALVEQIHLRVLRHIKALSERD